MTLWELRFKDGRGASFYTALDVTDDLGKVGKLRTISVASDVSVASALPDAAQCIQDGRVIELVADMGAIAYAVRHVLVLEAADS